MVPGLNHLAQATESSDGLGLEKLWEGQESLLYYAICGVFFVLCGLACGYFIWRKGHMQMLDAELEVKRTESELKAAEEDLKLEEREVVAGKPAAES